MNKYILATLFIIVFVSFSYAQSTQDLSENSLVVTSTTGFNRTMELIENNVSSGNTLLPRSTGTIANHNGHFRPNIPSDIPVPERIFSIPYEEDHSIHLEFTRSDIEYDITFDFEFTEPDKPNVEGFDKIRRAKNTMKITRNGKVCGEIEVWKAVLASNIYNGSSKPPYSTASLDYSPFCGIIFVFDLEHDSVNYERYLFGRFTEIQIKDFIFTKDFFDFKDGVNAWIVNDGIEGMATLESKDDGVLLPETLELSSNLDYFKRVEDFPINFNPEPNEFTIGFYNYADFTINAIIQDVQEDFSIQKESPYDGIPSIATVKFVAMKNFKKCGEKIVDVKFQYKQLIDRLNRPHPFVASERKVVDMQDTDCHLSFEVEIPNSYAIPSARDGGIGFKAKYMPDEERIMSDWFRRQGDSRVDDDRFGRVKPDADLNVSNFFFTDPSVKQAYERNIENSSLSEYTIDAVQQLRGKNWRVPFYDLSGDFSKIGDDTFGTAARLFTSSTTDYPIFLTKDGLIKYIIYTGPLRITGVGAVAEGERKKSQNLRVFKLLKDVPVAIPIIENKDITDVFQKKLYDEQPQLTPTIISPTSLEIREFLADFLYDAFYGRSRDDGSLIELTPFDTTIPKMQSYLNAKDGFEQDAVDAISRKSNFYSTIKQDAASYDEGKLVIAWTADIIDRPYMDIIRINKTLTMAYKEDSLDPNADLTPGIPGQILTGDVTVTTESTATGTVLTRTVGMEEFGRYYQLAFDDVTEPIVIEETTGKVTFSFNEANLEYKVELDKLMPMDARDRQQAAILKVFKNGEKCEDRPIWLNTTFSSGKYRSPRFGQEFDLFRCGFTIHGKLDDVRDKDPVTMNKANFTITKVTIDKFGAGQGYGVSTQTRMKITSPSRLVTRVNGEPLVKMETKYEPIYQIPNGNYVVKDRIYAIKPVTLNYQDRIEYVIDFEMIDALFEGGFKGNFKDMKSAYLTVTTKINGEEKVCHPRALVDFPDLQRKKGVDNRLHLYQKYDLMDTCGVSFYAARDPESEYEDTQRRGTQNLSGFNNYFQPVFIREVEISKEAMAGTLVLAIKETIEEAIETIELAVSSLNEDARTITLPHDEINVYPNPIEFNDSSEKKEFTLLQLNGENSPANLALIFESGVVNLYKSNSGQRFSGENAQEIKAEGTKVTTVKNSNTLDSIVSLVDSFTLSSDNVGKFITVVNNLKDLESSTNLEAVITSDGKITYFVSSNNDKAIVHAIAFINDSQIAKEHKEEVQVATLTKTTPESKRTPDEIVDGSVNPDGSNIDSTTSSNQSTEKIDLSCSESGVEGFTKYGFDKLNYTWGFSEVGATFCQTDIGSPTTASGYFCDATQLTLSIADILKNKTDEFEEKIQNADSSITAKLSEVKTLNELGQLLAGKTIIEDESGIDVEVLSSSDSTILTAAPTSVIDPANAIKDQGFCAQGVQQEWKTVYDGIITNGSFTDAIVSPFKANIQSCYGDTYNLDNAFILLSDPNGAVESVKSNIKGLIDLPDSEEPLDYAIPLFAFENKNEILVEAYGNSDILLDNAVFTIAVLGQNLQDTRTANYAATYSATVDERINSPLNFKVLVINDGLNRNFLSDFETTYSTELTQLFKTNGLQSMSNWTYLNKTMNSGLYEVTITGNITVNNNTIKYNSVEISMEKLKDLDKVNPNYAKNFLLSLPIDGEVGANKKRNGYGYGLQSTVDPQILVYANTADDFLDFSAQDTTSFIPLQIDAVDDFTSTQLREGYVMNLSRSPSKKMDLTYYSAVPVQFSLQSEADATAYYEVVQNKSPVDLIGTSGFEFVNTSIGELAKDEFVEGESQKCEGWNDVRDVLVLDLKNSNDTPLQIDSLTQERLTNLPTVSSLAFVPENSELQVVCSTEDLEITVDYSDESTSTIPVVKDEVFGKGGKVPLGRLGVSEDYIPSLQYFLSQMNQGNMCPEFDSEGMKIKWAPEVFGLPSTGTEIAVRTSNAGLFATSQSTIDEVIPFKCSSDVCVSELGSGFDKVTRKLTNSLKVDFVGAIQDFYGTQMVLYYNSGDRSNVNNSGWSLVSIDGTKFFKITTELQLNLPRIVDDYLPFLIDVDGDGKLNLVYFDSSGNTDGKICALEVNSEGIASNESCVITADFPGTAESGYDNRNKINKLISAGNFYGNEYLQVVFEGSVDGTFGLFVFDWIETGGFRITTGTVEEIEDNGAGFSVFDFSKYPINRESTGKHSLLFYGSLGEDSYTGKDNVFYYLTRNGAGNYQSERFQYYSDRDIKATEPISISRLDDSGFEKALFVSRDGKTYTLAAGSNDPVELDEITNPGYNLNFDFKSSNKIVASVNGQVPYLCEGYICLANIGKDLDIRFKKLEITKGATFVGDLVDFYGAKYLMYYKSDERIQSTGGAVGLVKTGWNLVTLDGVFNLSINAPSFSEVGDNRENTLAYLPDLENDGKPNLVYLRLSQDISNVENNVICSTNLTEEAEFELPSCVDITDFPGETQPGSDRRNSIDKLIGAGKFFGNDKAQVAFMGNVDNSHTVYLYEVDSTSGSNTTISTFEKVNPISGNFSTERFSPFVNDWDNDGIDELFFIGVSGTDSGVGDDDVLYHVGRSGPAQYSLERFTDVYMPSFVGIDLPLDVGEFDGTGELQAFVLGDDGKTYSLTRGNSTPTLMREINMPGGS